ncbi:MAG: FtsX-like permease family protein, partial [Candidatus Hodarchaeota archaeon]
IRLKNGNFMDETISELESQLKAYLHILIIRPEQQADIFTFSFFSDIISRLNLLFGVLFIIALIRLFHTISWFVEKYERDLLIMRSMGMSSFQMISLVLLLAGIIGNVGLFTGIILGFLIPTLIVAILTLFFREGFLIPNFAGSTLISLFLLSNVITLIAALYPAINITLKRPGTISMLTEGINR